VGTDDVLPSESPVSRVADHSPHPLAVGWLFGRKIPDSSGDPAMIEIRWCGALDARMISIHGVLVTTTSGTSGGTTRTHYDRLWKPFRQWSQVLKGTRMDLTPSH
jgi:hypothetical protein